MYAVLTGFALLHFDDESGLHFGITGHAKGKKGQFPIFPGHFFWCQWLWWNHLVIEFLSNRENHGKLIYINIQEL